MKQELRTESELLIGCMAHILKPVFLDDKEEKYTKAQLKFTRRLVEYEQKFYSLPEAKDRALRKHSLGVLLYQFVIYKHHEASKSYAAHQYVTQDIADRQTGKTTVPKDKVKQTIWEMYDPDFTGGIDLSSAQFKDSTIGLDLSVQIKKSADYNRDYFDNNIRYQSACGPFTHKSTDHDFLFRMNSLLHLPDYLANMWNHALDVRSGVVDDDEEPNEWGISSQEYRQFDVSGVLPDVKSVVQEFMETQAKYLSDYLSRFEQKSEVAVIVHRLKNLCLFIPTCPLVDKPYLQQLIHWELRRMQVGIASSHLQDQSNKVRSKLRLFCFQTLLPDAIKEIKSPTREDLAASDNKEIIAHVPKDILGISLPSRCGEIYFSLPVFKVQANEKIIELENELKKAKDEDEYFATEQKISLIQNALAIKSVGQMRDVSPEQLKIVRENLLLLLKQESYGRRLAAKVSLDRIKSFLVSQLSIIKIKLAENAKRAAELTDKTNQSSEHGGEQSNEDSSTPSLSLSAKPLKVDDQGPPTPKVPASLPTRRVGVLNRWPHEPAQTTHPEAKKFSNPGKLKVTQLHTVQTVLTGVRGRASMQEKSQQSSASSEASTLVFVLPPLPPS